jgi:hypothetical protein
MQTFYLINCKKNNSNCYYARGVHITNIPFHTYKSISLQKITQNNRKQFIHDLYPAFLKFLKAIKLYYKLCKNANFILKREIQGTRFLPQFRNILQRIQM